MPSVDHFSGLVELLSLGNSPSLGSSKKDSLWIKWINCYYMKNGNVMSMGIKDSCSWILKGILKQIQKIQSLTNWSTLLQKDRFVLKIMYNELQDVSSRVPWRKLFFSNLARPCAKFVFWTVCHDRLATKVRMMKFGLLSDTKCNFCDHLETIDHLLFEYAEMKDVWIQILEWQKINHQPKKWIEELSWAMAQGKGKGHRATLLKTALTETVYELWKYRNEVSFGEMVYVREAQKGAQKVRPKRKRKGRGGVCIRTELTAFFALVLAATPYQTFTFTSLFSFLLLYITVLLFHTQTLSLVSSISLQIHSPFPNMSQRYDNNVFKSHINNIQLAPGITETLHLPPPLQTEPTIRGKQNGKSKGPRNAKSANADSPNSTAVNNCRYDSSLGLLTKKFVSLIQDAKDGTLDLNRTAEILEVQKRRIYDITNVLEGVGLIEKTSKNHIQWKGCDGLGPQELEDQVNSLKAEVDSLYAEESELDDCIRKKQELLRNLEESESSQKYLFLTKEDILSLPCFQNQEIIAIKAPKASCIEVPDPDEELGFRQRQYKMIVRSAIGPINLYLLSKDDSKFEDDSAKRMKLMDPSWNSDPIRKRGVGLLESQHDEKNPSEHFSLQGSQAFGIQEITPTDFEMEDDYWFQSDPGVSQTELWGNE
ncbi:Transcription factor E2FC isoform B [Glycine soja]|nr:Transcription factor E2FC isoform B [Glycine soja]